MAPISQCLHPEVLPLSVKLLCGPQIAARAQMQPALSTCIRWRSDIAVASQLSILFPRPYQQTRPGGSHSNNVRHMLRFHRLDAGPNNVTATLAGQLLSVLSLTLRMHRQMLH